jgi:hypothetical protein
MGPVFSSTPTPMRSLIRFPRIPPLSTWLNAISILDPFPVAKTATEMIVNPSCCKWRCVSRPPPFPPGTVGHTLHVLGSMLRRHTSGTANTLSLVVHCLRQR